MNLQEEVSKPLGLYVHVPFCALPCDYCAFYKERPNRHLIERYLHALGLELERIHDDRCFDTIYFGGGTPGILTSAHVDQIAEYIHNKLRKTPKEWTVELSPHTVSEERLASWRAMGVNRISLGVQSFNAHTLSILGRKQDPQQIFRAYALIRKLGFNNVGFDLIFSAPGQTLSQVIEDLSTAIGLNPEHISTYCLTYEQSTPLIKRHGNKAEEDRDCDFYAAVWDFLKRHQYVQYEISNFCHQGYISLHNYNTWHMEDWIGIGPSASSQYRHQRYTNIASLVHWAEGMETQNLQYKDKITFNDSMLAADKIIFGLRMNEGVNLEGNLHKEKLGPFFQDLEKEGLLIHKGARIRLTVKGQLLCDAIAVNILSIIE
jgi:oxygen-independent coproporphyrinogen-3 oxidase